MRSKLFSQHSDVIFLPSVFGVDICTDVKKTMTAGDWALPDHGSGPSSENTRELFITVHSQGSLCHLTKPRKLPRPLNTRPCIVLVNIHMGLTLFFVKVIDRLSIVVW